MPFNNTLPEWNKTATAPTQTKKDAGWSAGEHPPASIFDWFFNTTYKALQELQAEAINTDQKGVNNGVATLDATGDLPIGQADNILNWVKGFGLGDVIKQIISGDANTIDQTGFYYIDGTSTNGPIAATGFYIINLKFSTPSAYQMAFHSGTQKMYFRRKSTTWGTWVEIAQYDATGKVAIANLPAATTAAAGIAQLNDTITSTSTTQAATANAVKQIADKAQMSKFIQDTGSLLNSSTMDLNATFATGFYYYSGGNVNHTNGPQQQNAVVEVYQYAATTALQVFTLMNTVTPRRWIRYCSGGTWGAWVEVAQYDSAGKTPIANLPAATTSAAGIAQLNDTITSTSTTQAATANAVKQVVDWAKGFGLGDIAKDISSTDLNTLDMTGFYKGNNMTNSPNTANFYFIINLKSSSTTKTQIAVRMSTSLYYETFIRHQNAGTWYGWVQMETTDGAQAKANTAEANAKNASTPIAHVGTGGAAHANAVAGGAAGFMTGADKTKLDGIAAGAEVNQNTFSTVQVNGTNIVSDTKQDTIFINSGPGVTLTPDAAIDAFTISLATPIWTNLTLQNGTTVFSTRTPRYTKQGDEVIIDGEIVATGAGVVIATLPAGYRPPQVRSFKCSQNWSTSNDGATIYVNTDGTITLQVAASYAQSISLSNIRFFLS